MIITPENQDVILEMEPIATSPLVVIPTSVLAVTPASLLQIAVQQGADLDRLDKLMELNERWEANEAKKAFTNAMAEFKANPPDIFKDKLVGYANKDGSVTGYMHATLGNVCEKIVSALAKVGISHKWEPVLSGSAIAVVCVLTHRLGHSEGTRIEATADVSGKKNSIQAIASTISYLQRYTLLVATGLATQDQDNDAADHAEAEPEWVSNAHNLLLACDNRAALSKEWSGINYTCRITKNVPVYSQLKAVMISHRDSLPEVVAA